MKYKHLMMALLMAPLFAIAKPTSGNDFVKGADVGFLTGQEKHGVIFHDRNGKNRECLELLKNDYDISAIRMRVWVNPRNGSCDKNEVLAMAKRVKALGMDFMVDFHYSDSWADPAKQPIPEAWKKHTYKQMLQDVRQHTIEVLTLLKDNGITPRWVQVGNETTNGMLWPMGQIKKNPRQYAGFIRAGYDAVKEIFPEALVIVHLDRGHRQSLYDHNFDTILKYGGKFDMIGMSLYPYWAMDGHPELNADDIISDCIANIRHVSKKYNCDVMIVETGYEVDEAHPEKMDEGRRQLARVIKEARTQTNGRCRGVFYWEPQCMPGGYKLGAFDSKAAPTAIMDGFIDGLERHDFFYAGQSKRLRMFKVSDGQVSWAYDNATRPDSERLRGEISDAVLMTDGHILIAHQYGVAEIDAKGNTVWSYPAPNGCEIHTIQPIGRTHVVFVQNGKPAKAVVMEIPSKKIVKEFELPVNEKSSVHGQFRNARLTQRGTLLIANMSLGCIHEYNCNGQEVDRWTGFLPWSVQELPKGNILITGRKGLIQEINRQGQTVWQMNTTDFGITQPQKTVRLKNGNHIVNNWYNEWNKTPMDSLHAPIQAVEVDKNGKVVWQLSEWKNPDLGPSTTIQLLSDAIKRERLFFGDYNAQKPRLFVKPNEPIGEGKGIHPGRVAWIHNPGVAQWDGKTGLWVEDRWNSQAKADVMIREAVVQLTGESTPKKAWKALFKHFNKQHGRGNRGYKKGEMIAIKLNMNNAITQHDTIELNSSPFVTLALVKSMVNEGGIREQDIVICEPSRAITDSIYNKVHRMFPQVRFIDNIGGRGREKCEYYPEQIVYSEPNGKMARGLAKCIVDADYLINSALLKTHSGPGVTLTGKNWYGATDIHLLWRQNAHNGVSQDKRNGKPAYKTFVDWMAHKNMGQKALLYLIDGTYGSRDVNGAPNPKWMKEPFNGDWACSIIMSQDEVACDAVGMDIIIGEWPEFGSLNFCDEYLREAASIPNAPSGTVYKFGGQPLTAPLGLFEHWNNQKASSADPDSFSRRYTKIDLKYKKL